MTIWWQFLLSKNKPCSWFIFRRNCCCYSVVLLFQLVVHQIQADPFPYLPYPFPCHLGVLPYHPAVHLYHILTSVNLQQQYLCNIHLPWADFPYPCPFPYRFGVVPYPCLHTSDDIIIVTMYTPIPMPIPPWGCIGCPIPMPMPIPIPIPIPPWGPPIPITSDDVTVQR